MSTLDDLRQQLRDHRSRQIDLEVLVDHLLANPGSASREVWDHLKAQNQQITADALRVKWQIDQIRGIKAALN